MFSVRQLIRVDLGGKLTSARTVKRCSAPRVGLPASTALVRAILVCLFSLVVVGTNPPAFAQRSLDEYLNQGRFKHVDSVFFLGMFNSQEDADRLKRAGQLNPVTGEPFNQVFAFGISGDAPWVKAWEVSRVVGDNLQFSLMTNYGKIDGLALKIAVAHSNGNDVLANAIKAGIVRVEVVVAVAPPAGFLEEARHLPGVKKVTIYRTEGDPVAERLGKKSAFGFLQEMGDLNIGVVRMAESDHTILGFEVRIPVGEGSSGPVIEEHVSGGNDYLTDSPHNLDNNIANIVLARMYEIDMILRNWDALCDLRPRTIDEEERRDMLREELRRLRELFPRAREQFDIMTRGRNGGRPLGPGTVRSGGVGGIESHPLPPILLAQQVLAAPMLDRATSPDLAEFLPVSGPAGTTAVPMDRGEIVRDTNAVEARAVDFRLDPQDESTTVAVVLVTKTKQETYEHDYHVCARFKGSALRHALPVSLGGPLGNAADNSGPFFWHCSMYDEAANRREEATAFSVFVDEHRRRMFVDSRWVCTEYTPYWRDAAKPAYDHILNFQVWSSSSTFSQELLLSVLSRLSRASGNWEITFANRERPAIAAVLVEAATLQDDAAVLSVYNRLARPRLAAFHGTKRFSRHGEDIFFEHWVPLPNGRTIVRLPLGRIDNAVVFCESEGSLDKVYISRDELRPLPGKMTTRHWPHVETAVKPSIVIHWPPDQGQVAVLQDLTGMPDDYRVAVNGSFSGVDSDCHVDVDVFTNAWYRQENVVVRDGLWGAHVYLSGQGPYNSHKIRVTLRDRSGQTLASHTVKGIVRHRP